MIKRNVTHSVLLSISVSRKYNGSSNRKDCSGFGTTERTSVLVSSGSWLDLG